MIRASKISDIEFILPLWSELDKYVANITKNEVLNSRVKEYDEVVSKTIREFSNSQNQKLFVAEENSNLIGFSTAYIESLPWFSPVTGLIGSCWVNEDYRNKGIGRELVINAENWLNSKNVSNIQVCWDKENPLANSFWRKNGYIESQIRATKQL